MKYDFLLFEFTKKSFIWLIIFLSLASFAFGQGEWIRIEGEDKEITASMPSNFLVDAVKKDYDNQKLRIISFQNGVQMEFLTYDEANPQKYLKELKTAGDSKTISSGGNSFNLKIVPDKAAENHFSEIIYLASKKHLYCFYIRAENADKPEVSRFLYSIKVNGKPIFINKEQDKTNSEKSISVAQLKTSPEIQTALNLSFENTARKINYEFKKIKSNREEIDFSIRPEIILVFPYPTSGSLSVKPSFNASYMGQNSGTATVKMKLMAKGQVGDITFFSTSDRRILYEFMEGIKKFRFLPAMKDGKPIDSELTIEFNFPYY